IVVLHADEARFVLVVLAVDRVAPLRSAPQPCALRRAIRVIAVAGRTRESLRILARRRPPERAGPPVLEQWLAAEAACVGGGRELVRDSPGEAARRGGRARHECRHRRISGTALQQLPDQALE